MHPVTRWQNGYAAVATAASKDPAPLSGKDLAPLSGKDLAPLSGKDLAPLSGKDPAPLSGKDPAPLSGKDPAPLPGKDPAPLPGKDPAPLSGKDPAPLSGKDLAPLSGTAPPSKPPAARLLSARGKRMLLVCGSLALMAGIVSVTSYQTLYQTILDSSLELSPDSPGYPYWVTMPFPIYIRLFFWTVTNWQDVQDSQARPVLREMGPYTYIEKYQKVNVTWNNNNGTVTYMQRKTWYFQPHLSNGTVEDNVTCLNVPLLVRRRLTRSTRWAS